MSVFVFRLYTEKKAIGRFIYKTIKCIMDIRSTGTTHCILNMTLSGEEMFKRDSEVAISIILDEHVF